jgi:cation:H+ antiporter
LFLTILSLLGSIFLVFVASLLFINALEWLGHHLKLGSSFVGAILSPLFTSLPELIVILIAIFSKIGETGSEIGIGTIFGEPFMVSSLSYGLVGIAVITLYLHHYHIPANADTGICAHNLGKILLRDILPGRFYFLYAINVP